ncbi:MAG: NTP transferase domain-containing protein [Firmicutes bacterium]|nr:NTP transferase domain-containing protein [Bacillota bacterium]
MKAIVMAGGSGSRLRPLTCALPKPMVPVMNRPLMEYTLELLYLHGFREVAATLQYLPGEIEDALGDGSRFGLNMHYYIEEEPLGTAGSVKNAAAFLDETFMVISGDALTDFDLSAAVEFHHRKGAMATLILTSVNTPLEYGIVITADDGRITRFVEKPGWGEVFSDTANTGIYILEPEVLDLIEPGKMFDFSKDLFPILLERKEPLFGCVLPGYWCDIGNLEQYSQAHRDILGGKVALRLAAREAEKGVWLEEGVLLHPHAKIVPPVYIGRDSVIEARASVQESIFGSGNFIGEQASAKRCIAWNGVSLGKKSVVRGAILCSSVHLEPSVQVYEGAVIGKRSTVEEGAVIKPEVKIWPEKRVENGSTLRENLIWGTRGLRSLFGFDGVRGEINHKFFPESAARLGAAFASFLEGGSIAIGGDAYGATHMFKQALSAGIASAGAEVFDLGETIIPILRRQIVEMGIGGGVFVRFADTDPPVILFKFMDGRGLDLSRGEERNVEQLYFRDDFPRCSGISIKKPARLPDPLPQYRKGILKRVDRESIGRTGFRIVIGYSPPLVERALFPLLRELRCRVISLNPNVPLHEEPCSLEALRHYRQEVATAVRQISATLGVIFDPGAEEMMLFDERGRVVEGELYKALISLLLFRMRKGETVAVPVNASGVIEKLAARYQGKVLRTRTAPSYQMNALQQEKGQHLEGFSSLSLNLDCIGALVYLLEFMALQETNLSTLLTEIPDIYLLEKQVPCPWEEKGRVMRMLIEETAGKRTEMIDGLKVHHPEGWALVLPHPEKPAYNIYGEGFDEEISASLTDLYARKVDRLIRKP